MAGAANDWRAWLKRHGPALVLFARQWTRDHAAAEDAVQEGFVRFWTARDRAEDPLAYVYRCVRNAALEQSRGERRREKREAARPSIEEAALECGLEHEEERQGVEEALSQLPAEQREAVVMKIWGELTFRQIGQATGIGENTAAARYRYALEKLEARLADDDVKHEDTKTRRNTKTEGEKKVVRVVGIRGTEELNDECG